jgi:hypothetical protein
MELKTVIPAKKRSGNPKSPTAGQLARYLNTKTSKAAVDLMIMCAVVGDNYWETLLDYETVQKISETPDLEDKFITALCKQPGQPFAHEVVNAYFKHISDEAKAIFFSEAALKRRSHPASLCMYGASFSSESGLNLTKVLAQLINHGLSADFIVNRNMADIERAASLGHRALLKIITPRLSIFPEEVIRSILTKSMHPIISISILVDECGVPLVAFSSQKMISIAKQEARCYINARLSRAKRIPEAEIKDDDSSEDHVDYPVEDKIIEKIDDDDNEDDFENSVEAYESNNTM